MNTNRPSAEPTGSDLADALRSGELRAVYQPIVAVPSRTVTGVETLARWTHPTIGPIPPMTFVPAFEQNGLAEELDRYMLHQACTDLAEWLASGGLPVSVSVNISPRTLSTHGAGQRLLDVISAAGVPRPLVCFELTENSELDDPALREVLALRTAGCLISLDDFGAGFAGLGRLQSMDADQLKIDASIVQAMTSSSASFAVMHAVVALAGELGLAVVAEGVEVVEHERILQAAGVTSMQGYLFARPMPSFAEAVGLVLVPAFTPAPTHPRELERLAALRAYDVLDTGPEEAFDALTRIAAEVCGTDIALITLVDEARQWFKSAVGFDLGETPRDVSFCGHAIIGDDVFVVDDATKDDRFAGNPYVVAESGVRMYAGAPLISAEGLAVGTLCVISERPGHLDEAQLRMLRTLASQVVSHLELRAVSSRLAQALEDKSEVERALRHEASHDQLTGLANRRLFFSTLESAIAVSDVGVLYVDLDGFKAVNDVHGHHIGDELLIWTAEALRGSVRGHDLVARIGGDEFAVVVGDGGGQIDVVAQRVRDALCRRVEVGGAALVSAASVGTAMCGCGDDPHLAMRGADEAMYADKRARRATAGRVAA